MGFLTGLITGAARQVNQNYDEAKQEQYRDMSQQQAMFDRVVANNNAMRNKAQQIADTTTSYEALYNIPHDMAYSVATNPDFQRMNEEDRRSYISTLKPTGTIIQGQPPQTAVIPGMQQNRGMLGGGTINVPPRQVQMSPGTPSRMGYAPTGPMPNQKSAQDAFKTVSTMLQNGVITDPQQAELTYRQLSGGQPSGYNWSALHQLAASNSSTKDPVFKQKIDYLVQNGVNKNLAIGVVTGMIHAEKDQLGRYHIIDYRTGKELDPNSPEFHQAAGLINNGAGNDMNQQPSNQVPQSNSPAQSMPAASANPQVQHGEIVSPPIAQPYQAPAAPGQSPVVPQQNQASSTPQHQSYDVTGGAANPPQLPAPKWAPWVSKQDYEVVTQTVQQAPINLANIDKAIVMTQRNPQALGVTGALIKHVAQPAVAVTDAVSPTLGNSIDKATGASAASQYHAMINLLKAQLTRPLTANSTGNRISNVEREQVEKILGDENWEDSPQSALSRLELLRTVYMKSVASNIDSMYPPPQDLASNVGAQKARWQFLVSQLRLSKQDAYGILYNEMAATQGQGEGASNQPLPTGQLR